MQNRTVLHVQLEIYQYITHALQAYVLATDLID